jgi:hypothetical protein
MGQFSSAGGGGVPVQLELSGGISSYSVAAIEVDGEEVEIVIPTTAVWIQIYNRTDGLTKLWFESDADYSTLPPGGSYVYSKKSGSAMTLYVQCPKAAQVVELTYGHSV